MLAYPTDRHIGLQYLKTFSMEMRLASCSRIDTPGSHRQDRGAKDFDSVDISLKSRQKLLCKKKKAHALIVRR